MAKSIDKFNLLKRLERFSVGEIPLSEIVVKIGLILYHPPLGGDPSIFKETYY